ncbi:MAG: diaminopimelate decarboxylase [Burkholderiaceae bacterium]
MSPDIAPHFEYRCGRLHVENVALETIAARFGTPAYVYSKAALVDAYAAYANAAGKYAERGGALICYAVKVNSNLAILNLFASLGAGFDIVSGGELARVIAAGGDPGKVIFSGVGKSRSELQSALAAGIRCFNVESVSELRRLSAIAGEAGCVARISLRVNPDVDAKTHPYISTGLAENKFGIAHRDAREAYREATRLPHLAVIGIDCHIGSQLLDDTPLLAALDRLIELIDSLAEDGIEIDHIDLGGGLGILYGNESDGATPPAPADYLARVFAHIDAWRAVRHDGKPIGVMFEPGRSLVGKAGILMTAVEVLKPGATKNFAVVDAAMNDLLRPALYDAWHEVVPVVESSTAREVEWDLVGPICESGDWLARRRKLKLVEGNLLAFLSAGAYGMAMASNYNTRPRAIELLVDGDDVHVIRERESVASLYAGEHVIA